MVVRRARVAVVLALATIWIAFWAAPALAQDFDTLSERQKNLLAPLEEQWAELPATRRQGLIEMADRVADQPPVRQERFRRGLNRFQSLAPTQRQSVRKAFDRFRGLAPEERRRVVERVMAMPEGERRAFALGMRIADRTQRPGGRFDGFLRNLPPERRRELLAEMRGLSPPERLRRLADELENAAPGDGTGDDMGEGAEPPQP